MTSNLQKQQVWSEVKDYFFISLGLLIYTISFVLFLMPYQIVAGGATGMSAIIYYATGFHMQYTYIIINGLLLIMALFILGFKFMVKTIYAILLLAILITLMQAIVPKQPNGSDIIAASVNKYHDISLGRVLIAIDFCIIGSCMFFPAFGTYLERAHKVMFGLCVMTLENFSLDYIMNARRESVQFLIFSCKYQELAEAIGTETGHGVTILDGHGWYTGKEVKVLCVLAKKFESTTIFRLIKFIDPRAFVSQSSVVGVYGEGFDEMKVKINKKLHQQRLQQQQKEQA